MSSLHDSFSAEHEMWASSVAPYVLGALGDDELARFRAHLSACDVCGLEAVALQMVVDALPATVAPVPAPSYLKGRIMATVCAEAELLHAAGASADRPPRPPRRRWRPALGLHPAGALAGVGLLAVGLAVGALALTPATPTVRSITARVDASSAPGASAALQRRGHDVQLQISNLPSPRPGHIYELWLSRSGQAPQPDGLFAIQDGSVSVPGDLHGVRKILVTVEPQGGSRVATHQPVIDAPLS